MNVWLSAYIGPETVLPVTSALAAICGAFLMFGGYLRRKLVAALGMCFRQKQEEDDD